jgi:acetyltransferase
MLRGGNRSAPPACEAHTIMNTPSITPESETRDRSLGLAGGKLISVRAAVPSDAGRLQAYVRGLSGKARHNRFLGSISELTPAQLERIVRMNRPHALALLAFAPADLDQGPIGEAMLVMEPGSARAEIALSVADGWQGKGVGTMLLQDLERQARMIGARYLFGDVLRTNSAMKALARKAGFAIRSRFADARLVGIVKELFTPARGAKSPCAPRGIHDAPAWRTAPVMD